MLSPVTYLTAFISLATTIIVWVLWQKHKRYKGHCWLFLLLLSSLSTTLYYWSIIVLMGILGLRPIINIHHINLWSTSTKLMDLTFKLSISIGLLSEAWRKAENNGRL